jgi:hypothetical protein
MDPSPAVVALLGLGKTTEVAGTFMKDIHSARLTLERLKRHELVWTRKHFIAMYALGEDIDAFLDGPWS